MVSAQPDRSRPAPSRTPGPDEPVRMRSGRAKSKRVDRSRWRRQLRARPRLRGAYRAGVGVTGISIMLLAIAIGWLPGPGGIPLFLVGLAVLATEFVWASRVLRQADRTARQAARWSARQPRWVHRLMAAGLAAGICFGLWLVMAIFGRPGWLPAWLDVLPLIQGPG